MYHENILAILPSFTSKQSVGASRDQLPAVKLRRSRRERAGNEWVSTPICGLRQPIDVLYSLLCRLPDARETELTVPAQAWAEIEQQDSVIDFVSFSILCVWVLWKAPINEKRTSSALSPSPTSSVLIPTPSIRVITPGYVKKSIYCAVHDILNGTIYANYKKPISYYTCQPKS